MMMAMIKGITIMLRALGLIKNELWIVFDGKYELQKCFLP
jgi:hypothetical protein